MRDHQIVAGYTDAGSLGKMVEVGQPRNFTIYFNSKKIIKYVLTFHGFNLTDESSSGVYGLVGVINGNNVSNNKNTLSVITQKSSLDLSIIVGDDVSDLPRGTYAVECRLGIFGHYSTGKLIRY